MKILGRIVGVIALVGASLAGMSGDAGATVFGSVTPQAPTTVTLGAGAVAMSVTVANANTGADATRTNFVCNVGDPVPCPAGGHGITLTPSCAAVDASSRCTTPDPGAFALPATAAGRTGTACAGIVFDVVLVDANSGRSRLTPQGGSSILLAGNGASCVIDLTATANRLPNIDAQPGLAGTQTFVVADAVQQNGTAFASAGRGQITVKVDRAPTTIATTASPAVLLGAPVSAVASVSGRFEPQASTVDFRLFGPDDASCAQPPVFEQLAVPYPVGGGSVTTDLVTLGAPGLYRWVASYGGDASNAPSVNGCGDPGTTVVVNPFEPPAFTRTITGDHAGPVVVNEGESVLIDRARVSGPVTVKPGGALAVQSSKLARSLVVDAPRFLSVCASELSAARGSAALTVRDAKAPIRVGDPTASCAGNRVQGPVSLASNLATVFGANEVAGPASITGGGGGHTLVRANIFHRSLGCSGNSPAPANGGQPNTAASASGQCTAI